MRAITKALMKRLSDSGLRNRYKEVGEDGSDVLLIYNRVSDFPVLMGINDSSAHILVCVTRLEGCREGEVLKDINAMNRNSCYVTYVLEENNVMVQSGVIYNDLTMVDDCMLILANLLKGAGTYRCILELKYN